MNKFDKVEKHIRLAGRIDAASLERWAMENFHINGILGETAKRYARDLVRFKRARL